MYLEHTFVMSNVIISRLDKKNNFGAFINIEKAFDWIDMDLLLYNFSAMSNRR